MIEITDNNLPIPSSGIAVVDFSANWCMPCKKLTPILETLSTEMSNVKFMKVDAELNSKLTQDFQIQALPTLLFFKDGKQVSKTIGLSSESKLRELINGL